MAQPDTDDVEVGPARRHYLSLLAVNPNYFDTFPDFGFEPQQKLSLDTTYEDLACVSYSPERSRLEATISIKRSTGYSGPLCSAGSFEYVRFWVDHGSGWSDAGMAAVNVHNIAAGRDCAGRSFHPISHVVGVDYSPRRSWCGNPQLPKVRAILSWGVAPPGTPPPVPAADWVPVWGDVKECRIQIRPRRFWWPDLAQLVSPAVLAAIPFDVAEVPPLPDPDPGPVKPLDFAQVAQLSRKADVPAHRYALPALSAAASLVAPTQALFADGATALAAADIDVSGLLEIFNNPGKGNTTYEEVYCVGIDEAAQALVASFVVKQSTGFSGGPCTPGSIEYVAFWADWEDTCDPVYLGTVQVRVHDFEKVGTGLHYAAILPVDLGALRRPCSQAKVSRIRAVLSWGVPPSTSDPDAVPHWGNWIDRHVQVAPGRRYDGTARFTVVGGVASTDVDLVTGLTDPGAVMAWNGTPLAPAYAFGGLVVLNGPLDPALAGASYRLWATNVDGPGSQLLTDPFTAVTSGGVAHTVTPNPVTGAVTWPTWVTNTLGALGAFAPAGEDRWDIELQLFIGAAWATVAVARVRMDSILRNSIVGGDTDNAGDLVLNTAAQCRVPKAPLVGTFVARDEHFSSWSIGVAGGPAPIVPPATLTTTPPLAPTSQTAIGGHTFTLDLTNLQACGYVVRLAITDRVIVNSASPGRTTYTERGICVE